MYNRLTLLLFFMILYGCKTIKFNSAQLNEVASKLTFDNCEDINKLKAYDSTVKFMEFGDGAVAFDIDFWIKQTSFKDWTLKALYDFEFDKYQDLYKQQKARMSKQEYSNVICGIRVISLDSIKGELLQFNDELKRQDSLHLLRYNSVSKYSRDSYLYKNWLLQKNKNSKTIKLALFPVPQFLIRYDGKKAIRTTKDKRGLVLHVYDLSNGNYVKESEEVVPNIFF